MFTWSNLQIIIDDHIDILLNRLIKDDVFDGFVAPRLKEYYKNILTWFLIFSVLYLSLNTFFKNVWKNKYYLKLSNYKRKDWNSRVVAFIHAIIVSPFCIFLICKFGFPWDKNENDYSDKEINIFYSTISISIGYFMWDIIYSVGDYKKGGIGFVIHGFGAFLIYIFTFKSNVLGHYAIMYLIYEFSTIFLHTYWVFDKIDLTGSIGQLISSLLLLVTFFTVRIAIGSIFIFKLLHDIIFDREVCSVYLSLYFVLNIIPMQTLNYIWFYKMIYSIFKHFEPSKKPNHESKSVKKTN
ncbi:hypothetical protein BCR36DRAFT_410281 [Piromyces finnis]|uniref:TLC domain-containing protein n=1 Tax=Piromyces finnis TaxID=1754191 RepID=A0A1Y1VGZ0_9FUNG|nr:hypothetical protein BCR36DRAFT_410281 [Piromyces finnis]|eukprot:ORX55343.1 hypothetical protein BCR36DRAFT_410281 [Piromyces finnis]